MSSVALSTQHCFSPADMHDVISEGEEGCGQVTPARERLYILFSDCISHYHAFYTFPCVSFYSLIVKD